VEVLRLIFNFFFFYDFLIVVIHARLSATLRFPTILRFVGLAQILVLFVFLFDAAGVQADSSFVEVYLAGLTSLAHLRILFAELLKLLMGEKTLVALWAYQAARNLSASHLLDLVGSIGDKH
jgi:hypothetical protein